MILYQDIEGVANALRNKSTSWPSAWLVFICETHVCLGMAIHGKDTKYGFHRAWIFLCPEGINYMEE